MCWFGCDAFLLQNKMVNFSELATNDQIYLQSACYCSWHQRSAIFGDLENILKMLRWRVRIELRGCCAPNVHPLSEPKPSLSDLTWLAKLSITSCVLAMSNFNFNINAKCLQLLLLVTKCSKFHLVTMGNSCVVNICELIAYETIEILELWKLLKVIQV